MDIKETLKEVIAGKKGVDSVDEALSLDRSSLLELARTIKEETQKAENEEGIVKLADILGQVLLRYALESPDEDDEIFSFIAMKAYQDGSKNKEMTELAKLATLALQLDPKALTILDQKLGEKLSQEERLKLLKTLHALSEGAEKEELEKTIATLTQALQKKGLLEQAQQTFKEGAPDEALRLVERYLAEHPADRAGLKLISDILVSLGKKEKCEPWFRRALSSQDDPQVKASILLDLATIKATLLGEENEVLSVLEEALQTFPSHGEALELYREKVLALGLEKHALEFMSGIRAKVAGKPEEAPLQQAMGELLARTGDIEGAERCFRRIRAIDPRNYQALRFYEDYYEQKGDYQKVFTTLQFMLSVAQTNEEKIRINSKMAWIAENRLNNLERAIDAYKRILQIDKDNKSAQDALVALYEKTRKWHALIDFYNEKIKDLPEDAKDEKVALLFRIIEIYQNPDKFPSEDNVLATYARIAEISPTDRVILDKLERGYEAKGRWHDLLRVLQKKVEITSDPVQLLELFHKISEIAITRMSNESQAIPFLERVLELDPQNMEVVAKLKEIYQRKHNQERVFAMMLKELEFLEGKEREEALLRAALMARDKLLRYEDALKLFEELYAINPNSREVRENLHSLYSRLERWNDYVRFLREEIERPMPQKRKIELMHRLGEILLDKVGRVQEAREVFEAILSEEPMDELAARRLEDIYLELEEIDTLKSLFAKRNDMRSFVALLAKKEAQEKAKEKKVLLNIAMAKACEEDLKEPGRAMRYLEKAYALDPSLVDVGRKLLRMYEASQNVGQTIALLKQLAPSFEDLNERAEAYLKLCRYLQAQGQLEEALLAGAEAMKILVAMGGGDEALGIVRDCASKVALWTQYARVLDEAQAITTDPEKRLALLLELGEVYETRLLYHDQARQVLGQVLDIDPANLEALSLLEDIALQLEDYRALEDVLSRKADIAKTPEERRDILLRLARLYEDLLGDDTLASERYMQVLESFPNDREALSGLHRTYERSERYQDLADVIRMEIESAGSLREKSLMRCELARLCYEHLEDLDETLNILKETIKQDPKAENAVQLLWELFNKGVARERCANIMAPYFRENGRYEDLQKLLMSLLDSAESAEVRATIWMQIGDIHGMVYGDVNKAFECYAKAVREYPKEHFVQRMIETAREAQRIEDAAYAIGWWVGVVPEGLPLGENILPDPTVEASLAMTLGRLYADELHDPVLAIRSFEKALPFREEDSELLKALLALYKEVNDTEQAMLTYDRLCGAVGDYEGKKRVLLEKASYAEEISKPDYAIEALHRILELRREDEEVRERLERVLLANGRYNELVEFLDGELAIETDPERQAEILYEMATIYRDHLNKPVEASLCLRRCLLEHPDFVDAEEASIRLVLDYEIPERAEVITSLLDVLETRLRGRDEARETFVKILEAKASVSETPWEKAVAYSEMAQVEHSLGNLENYYEACEKAFLCLPDDPKLLEKLVSAATLTGKEARMCEVLEEAAEKIRSSEAKVAVLLEAAKAYRDKLQDLPKAATIYDRLLEVSPQSPTILREMDALLKEMGRDAERIPLLEEVARLVATVEERREIYLLIGELCLKTGDLEGAVRAFSYVFERRPQESALDKMSKDAGVHLLELYENLGRYKTLVALRLQLGEMTEGDEAKEHFFVAGCVLHEKVKDLEQAKRVFQRVLEIAPMDPQALAKAKEVAREALDYEYLEKLLREEIDGCRDAQKRRDLQIDLAHVLDAMGDTRVLEPLSCVLMDNPSDADATEFVVRLLQNEVLALDAAKLLEDVASRVNDHSLLLKALQTQVKYSLSSEDEVATTIKVIETLKRLQRAEEALDTCTNLFIAYPENETVFKKLVAELKQFGKLENIVETTRQAVSNASDPIALRLRVAQVLLEEDMPEGAIALLGDNIDAQSDHRPTLECMVRAQRQANSPDGVVWALEMLAESTQDETEKASLLKECGKIAKEELSDLPRARQFYQDCLTYAPLDREVLQNLREIVEEMGDRKGLKELLRHELSHLQGMQGVVEELRKNELRRALCGFAMEDGDMDEAMSLAIDMLRSSQCSREDLFVAKDVYLKAQYPYPIFSLLVEKCTALQAQDCLLEVYRNAAKAGVAEPSRGEALRSAIALEESLGLKDVLFEDLESLLALAPNDPTLVEKLIKTGRELGRLDRVVEVLKEIFTEHQDEDIAFSLSVSLAKVLEEIGDNESAADYLRIAHLRKPEDKETIKALASLYEKMGRFGDLALLFESVGDTVEGDKERVRWYHLAQKVLREKVGDSGAGIEVLKKILEIEPEDMDAIEALIQEARKASDHENLVFGLEAKARANISPREKVKTLLELGKLLDEALGNQEKAVSVIEEAFAIDKSNSETREFLKDLYAETKKFEKLAGVLEVEALDAENDKERVEVLKKIAALYESQLSDIEMAKATLRRILEVEPRNEFALTRLEHILETEGDYRALIDLLDFRLKHAVDKNEATRLHSRAGQVLLEKLDAPHEAIARFKAALDLNPYDTEPRNWLEKMLENGKASMEACLALEELYENTGEHLKLCAVLRKEVSLLESPIEKEGILIRIAEILEEKLDDKDEAFSQLCEAFSLNPESEDTFDRLEKIAKATGKMEDLYRFLRGVAINQKDRELRAKLLWRCGQIAERELQDLKRAGEMFSAYLEVKEGDPDALVKLDEIYSKLGYSSMLAEVLRRRIGQGVGDEATLRMRLAEVLGTYLGDAQGAVEHLGEVLRHGPHDKEVVRRLSTYVDNEAVGARALELLIQALEESEDMEGLLWAYTKASLMAKLPEDKAVFHRKGAMIARELGKKAEELEHLGGLVASGRPEKEEIERYLALANETKSLKEAREQLEKGAIAAVSSEIEKELRLSLVRISKKVDMPSSDVEKHLKRVLEVDGACVEALNELEKLYVAEGRTEDTIALLYARLRLDIGTKERLILLRRLGELHDSLGEHERSAECLEEVVAIEPSDLETLRKLCRLYESLENYKKLVDCLTMLAHETKDERERRVSLLKATDLLVEKVGDVDAARTVLESLFQDAKQDMEVIRRLEKVYQGAKNFEALKNLYVEVLDSIEDERVRLDTAMKAAVLAEKDLHDTAFAIAMYKKALEMHPGFLPAIDELIRIYYKTQEWSQYVDTLRKKAQTVRVVGEKVSLLVKACDVAVTQLNDLELASNVASDILAIDPTNSTALLVKAKAMENRGESEEALDLYKRLALATGNVDERVEALCGIARLLLGRGEATNEVREALRTASRFKPDHPEVGRLQKLFYIENKEHKALVEVLQKELKQAKTDEQRASVCMQIAQIYLNELNDGQKFLQWAEEAFRYKSDDPQIVQALVNFHLRSGDPKRSVPLLEWLVNYLEGKRLLGELPKYAYELARLLEAQGDVEKAIQYYRVCHEYDAQNVPNALALGRLYVSRGEYEKALKVYQPLTLKIDSLEQSERVEVFLQLARIYESRGDKKKARQYVMRVLAEEPENADAQAFLKKGL